MDFTEKKGTLTTMKSPSWLINRVKFPIFLNEMTCEDRAVKLLRSIPGTGIVNACAVRGIIADVERFNDPKKMEAYAGLAQMRMIECGGATRMWRLASASVGEQFERDNSAWPYHEERFNDFEECHGTDGDGHDQILNQL